MLQLNGANAIKEFKREVLNSTSLFFNYNGTYLFTKPVQINNTKL